MATVEEQRTSGAGEEPTSRIITGEDYIESLRGRDLEVYLHGERVDEPVDHPVIRTSMNAIAESYDLAQREPELASVESPFTGERISRFLHICTSREDVVMQNKMQRRMGQLTGTCFQRCTGMDAQNSLYMTSYEIDQARGTEYHERLKKFTTMMHRGNYMVGAAMTDPKGDRSLPPHKQPDPDVFLRVVDENEDGIFIRGAKVHQTGCINSHWITFMPTMRLGEGDSIYATAGAVPVTAPGLTYICGRSMGGPGCEEEGEIDRGNVNYSGQEAMIVFDNVFVPWKHVFMHGEYEFAATLVEKFAGIHRRSYVCKVGVGDAVIGAAAAIADYNGTEKASHVRDKLVEMTHLNETIYGAGIASSYQSQETPSGAYLPDLMLSNVCKHHVTRFPYEIARLAQDLAGGLVVTMPSEKDLDNETTGPMVKKYLRGREGVSTEDRLRMVSLIENMTLGRNAIGYLTESMHGAGSPQAQRVQIARQMQLDEKKALAKRLAGIDGGSDETKTEDSYFERVFKTEDGCTT